MNYLSLLLARAHVEDLRREAENARLGAAAGEASRHSAPSSPRAVTLRIGTPADAPALRRLAALDSSETPAGSVLFAEVGGELRAAISLTDRAIIADPFHPIAPLVQLLLKWAEALHGNRSPRLRRLRDAVPRGAAAGPHPGPRFPDAVPARTRSLTSTDNPAPQQETDKDDRP